MPALVARDPFLSGLFWSEDLAAVLGRIKGRYA